MSEIFNTTLESNLLSIAAFLENDIKEILLEKGHKATGELISSIKNTVSRGSSSFTIEGRMGKQGIYIISGREKGLKGIPVDALVRWIENKKFSSGIKSTRGLAFAIQKSIKKKGIKPDDFISEVFEKRAGRIEKKINDSVEVALEASLTNLINKARKFT